MLVSSFPDLLNHPEKGEIVDAVDRNGSMVCEGKIIKVQNPKLYDSSEVIAGVTSFSQSSAKVKNLYV